MHSGWLADSHVTNEYKLVHRMLSSYYFRSLAREGKGRKDFLKFYLSLFDLLTKLSLLLDKKLSKRFHLLPEK